MNAARAGATIYSACPNLHFGLLVAICGTVPKYGNTEVLLGDIIISEDIFQYDFGLQ